MNDANHHDGCTYASECTHQQVKAAPLVQPVGITGLFFALPDYKTYISGKDMPIDTDTDTVQFLSPW